MFDFSPEGVRRAMECQAQRDARWLRTHRSGKLVSSLWSIALENSAFAHLLLKELLRQRDQNHVHDSKENS